MSLTAPDSSGSSLIGLLASSDKLSARLRRLLTTYVMVSSAAGVAKHLVHRGRSEITYTVAVRSDDAIYPTLHAAILDRLPATRRRALTATSSTARHDGPTEVSSPGERPAPPRLKLFYDGAREQKLSLDGHTIKVMVDRDTAVNLNLGGDGPRFRTSPDRLVFTAYGASARDAILRFIQQVTDDHHASDRNPDFFIAERWGGWDRRSDVPRRRLETVVLQAGQKERLVADVEDFLGSEQRYNELGIPWHRGILLEGPPGTGKTSLAQALATHFDLDVYFVPLSDLAADTGLLRLVSAVRPRSMLLLEDIDVLQAAKDREDKASESDTVESLSLSGLLNALDGLATPSGLITILTTNHPGVLDPALVRPGRVDRVEHIGVLDDDQLRRLVTQFLGPADLPPIGDLSLSPASVIEQLKRHPEPEDAIKAIIELLETT